MPQPGLLPLFDSHYTVVRRQMVRANYVLDMGSDFIKFRDKPGLSLPTKAETVIEVINMETTPVQESLYPMPPYLPKSLCAIWPKFPTLQACFHLSKMETFMYSFILSTINTY